MGVTPSEDKGTRAGGVTVTDWKGATDVLHPTSQTDLARAKGQGHGNRPQVGKVSRCE